MRRVPPPPAGFLVVERGDRRPGRQVRAAVRWAALHRDARHGAPLKSPSFLRGFFLSVRFAGRGELLPY